MTTFIALVIAAVAGIIGIFVGSNMSWNRFGSSGAGILGTGGLGLLGVALLAVGETATVYTGAALIAVLFGMLIRGAGR